MEEFELSHAAVVRQRFRWVVGFLLALWSFSFVFADVRLYGSRSQKLWVRIVELCWSAALLYWLRKKRSLVALEVVITVCSSALIILSSISILWVSRDQVNFSAVSKLLLLIVLVFFVELRWRAAAVVLTTAFVSLIAAYLVRMGREGLVTLGQSTMWVIAPLPLIVREAWRREQTQRREISLRRELASTNEQLTAEAALRTRLFAHLSHDLRTPLSVIRGEAELMLSSARGAEREALQRIVANVRFSSDLCEQLLEIARLDAGEAKSTPVDVPLAPLLRELCAQLRPTTGAVLEFRGDPLVVRADATELRRILSNLVANALAHVHPRTGRVVVEARSAGPSAIIEVSDDGPGIPAARRASLFERRALFANASGAPSGIGLPLAHELARRQGGALTLLEDRAQTTFRLTLPRVDAVETELAGPDPTASETPSGKPVVLVVEDSDALQSLFERVLSGEYVLLRARSVAHAKQSLEEQRVDAVLSDVMLPDGDGYDVLRFVRSQSSQVPFVFISARGEPGERARGLAAGADDFVAKPFSPDELRSRLSRALRRTESHRAQLEAQRQTLMMELHDGVSSKLAAARLLLDTGDAESVQRARHAVADALAETRAAFELIERDDAPLASVFADLRRDAMDAATSFGLAASVEVRVDSSLEGHRISAAHAHALRRLLSEALTNVARHAKASSIRITLEASQRRAWITVDDDGVGCPVDGPSGRGTQLARARALRFGGSLDVRPLAPRGTRFSASILLAAASEPASHDDAIA
jgi:signal transduction histidine kinase